MSDVRMQGFSSRANVDDVLAWIDDQLFELPEETVPLAEAAGRVLAYDVKSHVDVPGFDRAMMDGYAVIAADTTGASEDAPIDLAIVGQVLPGDSPHGHVESGQAVAIATGAPMPTGSNAVMPVEFTEATKKNVQVKREIAAGKHFGTRGEDIPNATPVLPAGRVLRPQDVGVLSSIGVSEIEVTRRVRVRIIATGNELLPPGSKPHGSKIADANTPMLDALIRRDGGIVLPGGIVQDNPASILAALRDDADVVVVSGGSSVGPEDHAPTLVAKHGQLAFHGVHMRPGSPSGVGRLDERLVFLLPGNPVSCLCAYDFFVGRAIRGLAGLQTAWPYRKITAKLTKDLPAAEGRLDYARVRQTDKGVEPVPRSGSSVLSSTTRADGFVLVPPKRETIEAGTRVEVFLYD